MTASDTTPVLPIIEVTEEADPMMSTGGAVALIDAYLAQLTGRGLCSVDEVNNLLLDLRLALTVEDVVGPVDVVPV